jgi:hypothetical protein
VGINALRTVRRSVQDRFTYGSLNGTASSSGYIVLNRNRLINEQKLERIWKQAVVA